MSKYQLLADKQRAIWGLSLLESISLHGGDLPSMMTVL